MTFWQCIVNLHLRVHLRLGKKCLVRGNDSLLFSRVHHSITRGKAQETPSPGAQLITVASNVQGHKTDTFRATQMPPDRTPESIFSDDIDFTTFVRKRTKRYYIGGLKSSITRNKLIAYVESKGLTVTWLNIGTSRRSGRAIIRLNVEMTEGCHSIAEPGFWPKGIKCRPWVTKSKYKEVPSYLW